jgi:hypothetical protein
VNDSLSSKKRAKRVPPEVFALIWAADSWAQFQHPDSIEDQKTDHALAGAAAAARDRLLQAIERVKIND